MKMKDDINELGKGQPEERSVTLVLADLGSSFWAQRWMRKECFEAGAVVDAESL